MQRNEARLLKFAIQYPGWHSCAPDSRATMRRLAGKGLLEVKEYGRKASPQFRIALPNHVWLAVEYRDSMIKE